MYLIEDIPRLDIKKKHILKKMGIETLRDMLYHFPSRYNNISKIKKINTLSDGDTAVIYGRVISTKTSKAYRKKIPIGEININDGSGSIKAVWFNQAYAAKIIKKGEIIKLAGHVQKDKDGKKYLANPEFEKTKNLPIDVGDSLFRKTAPSTYSYPIYPERKGITSRWLYHNIQKILKSGILEKIEDPIPRDILERYNLPSLKTALVWIHLPKKDSDAEAARKRFAFEEIFFIQIARHIAGHEYKKNGAFAINTKEDDIEHFIKRFPFTPTASQTRAIDAMRKDMAQDKPMMRLLEGDVGSGKTFVAASTAYATIMTHPDNNNFGNLQVAYMAPTEILANQHFDSFIKYFSHLPINVGLITGNICKKFPSKVNPSEATKISRTQLLKWVANGEIAILIGTHSLIQKNVEFKHLAYVIIDEQHRFGARQRAEMARKSSRAPHLLSMSATPIPRTLALTIYGDLDLTLLDEMPPGRKEVITQIVLPGQREDIYKQIHSELKKDRQAYIVCPRIDEPDSDKANALRVKSVKMEAKRLKENVFQDYEIEILHSKIKSKDKDDIMARFAKKEIDILVATSVVEVGVDIPNATIIIIEGAERFGLAQLHQLRGRVLRGSHQSYCFAFADTESKNSIERLNAFKNAKNGFELAELDLQLRGAGELSGAKQWGITDLGMEAIKNIKMVEAARKEARLLLEKDYTLLKHPLIKRQLIKKRAEIHFE